METREAVTLDARAQHRLFVLTQVLEGRLSVADVMSLLERSERQVKRLLAAVRHEGAAALVHGNRGRAPVHRTPEGLRARLVELATTTYAGVNRAHLAELLAEREGIQVPERTLRRVLAEAGVSPVRRRRRPPHRSRRERAAQAGRLLQVDGSRHRWLGPDRPFLTLLGAIDDATGIVTAAVFRAQEDAAGYLELFARTVAGYGVPLEVYSDRHGIFVVEGRRAPTLEEQLRGEEPRTQVGCALHEAGIGWIGAHSPQAKGRVERLWGTLQDRLLAELRLAGATTLEEANIVLGAHLSRHNARFAVEPADPEPAWRPWPHERAPESVFCSVPTPGRQRRDHRLVGHEPRAACTTRAAQLGGLRRRPRGAPRRQSLGSSRRDLVPGLACAAQSGAPARTLGQPSQRRQARPRLASGTGSAQRSLASAVRSPLAQVATIAAAMRVG